MCVCGGELCFYKSPFCDNDTPPPRHYVYNVFLCIWVKDVQYKSSVCSRFDFIFIMCVPRV